jgi:hypothetical protein
VPPGPKQVTPAREVYARRGPAASVLDSIKPRTPEDWRRAIILHEILSPPIGERPDHLQ